MRRPRHGLEHLHPHFVSLSRTMTRNHLPDPHPRSDRKRHHHRDMHPGPAVNNHIPQPLPQRRPLVDIPLTHAIPHAPCGSEPFYAPA